MRFISHRNDFNRGGRIDGEDEDLDNYVEVILQELHHADGEPTPVN